MVKNTKAIKRLVMLFIWLKLLAPERAIAEYRHELIGWMNYQFVSGASSSNELSQKSQMKGTGIDLALRYGYFMDNLVEPLLEIRYQSTSHKIGDLKQTAGNLAYGFGLLFNVPLGGDDAARRSTRFQNSRFIPFGGVMLSKLGTEEVKTESDESSEGNQWVTKLIFGMRYILFPNIAISSSLESYYMSDTSVQIVEDEELKRINSRLIIEARLLSISLLL